MWKKPAFIVLCIFAAIGFFLSAGYVAIKFGWTNATGVIDMQRQAFLSGQTQTASVVESFSTSTPDWTTTPEWQTLSAATVKDQGTIDRAAAAAGIPPRIIVEDLVAEQMRFFFDDRTSYEQFFAPLKILGSETQFSWGVMGVKETTAIEIEDNLASSTSAFYLGSEYAHLLDAPAQSAQNRFTLLTDQHDHYYSYLYAGLYLHEIEQQWKSAGFDISNRPDILATLYDVGFANSQPKADPQSGGASFQINGVMWSFGSLAASFYNSNELIEEFPR